MNRDEVMTFVKKSLKFLPDKSYIKLYYRLRVGRKLNTDNPTTLMKSSNGRNLIIGFRYNQSCLISCWFEIM